MDEISRDTLISASENRTMFDKIAKTYDKANRLISLGMAVSYTHLTLPTILPV